MRERVAAIQRQAPPAEYEWQHYLGDRAASHYSQLTQINRENVGRLKEVWRYDSGDAGEHGQTEIETNPLVIKGILYGFSPRGRLFALNAATGEQLWQHLPKGTKKGAKVRLRGMAYWEDGDEQRLLFTAGHYLVAVDARSGRSIDGFGEAGRVDLRDGFDDSVRNVDVKATSPGVIYRDLLIIGSFSNELSNAPPGYVRAYDVRNGALRWTFNTIPGAGEPGADSWPAEGREQFGGANSWAGMSLDEERGLVFVPTGSATFDFFGGHRAGDNLFANSLIALDASTGKRRWHYQIVRHDLWDRDLPAPPNLITVERNGEIIPAVAQATKSGHFFVFHRDTGEPLFPIEEVPVQGPGVPGEHLPVSQPVPLLPPPFARQDFAPTNRTPAAQAAVRARLESLDTGGPYVAPTLKGIVLYPGMDGGAEWGGAAYDPENGWLFINANEVPSLLRLTPTSQESAKAVRTPHFTYLQLCSGCHGADRRGDNAGTPSLVDISGRMGAFELYRFLNEGRGRMPSFEHTPWYLKAATVWYLLNVVEPETAGHETNDHAAPDTATVPSHYINAGWQSFTDPDGLPASEPPWGTLTAIDVNKAEIAWRVPLGDYPEVLAAGKSGLGSETYGGPVVTAGGLLFIASTHDLKFRAFDRSTGEVLWEADLPHGGFATPAVYMAQGRQYVVIAAGGGRLGQGSGGNYLAFALPD